MSLLLDALKEAEARKHEVAPELAAGPATVEPDFGTMGALALAEDPLPEPLAMPTPAPAPPRATAAPTPSETLLAAGAARARGTPAGGSTIAGQAPPPPVASTTLAAASPRTESPAGSRRAATATPATSAPRRGLLPWLLGFAALLALLVGGAFAYDAFVERAPLVVATPGTATPADTTLPAPLAPAAHAAPTPSSTSSPSGTPDAPGAGFALPEPSMRSPRPAPRDASARRREPTPDPPPPSGAAAPSRRATPSAPPAGDAATPRDARISISRESAPLDAAWAAQQSGDLERAASLYRRVLENEAGQVDAQLGLAVIAHARGDDAAARRGYRLVLESSPEHPRAWAGLAELAGEDETGGIESRLRQLLAGRPSAPLQFALGNLLAREARWSDAQQAYFAAATLAPDAPDYAYNVAVALERLGKPAAAMPWYARALQQAAAGRAVRFDATEARARLEQLQAAAP